MTSKRDLKKSIYASCSSVADGCMLTKGCISGIDCEKMDEIIAKIALAQVRSIKKVSVCFDKTPKSFDGDGKSYRKARRAYYKACYTELCKKLRDDLSEIIGQINSLSRQAKTAK